MAGINEVFEIREDAINSVVIESPTVLYGAVSDLKMQVGKADGASVLSDNNELLKISDNIHLITDVYGMNFDSRPLMTAIIGSLSKTAVDERNYEKTTQIIAAIQNHINDLAWELDLEIECSDMNVKQLIKTASINIPDDEDEIVDRIYKYMELTRCFLRKKLFIFLNVRGFIEQEKFELLATTLIEHDFKVIFIDNREYPRVNGENRLTIDVDLCEF